MKIYTCLLLLVLAAVAAQTKIHLPATIAGEVVTNWTVVTIESPVSRTGPFVTLEYHATGYHESGVIMSNTVANIEWRGKQIPVILESVQIGETNRVTWR